MRKLLAALTALVLTFSVVAPAAAADRVVVYPSQNPTSTQANLGPRYVRLALGNWIRDALGPAVSSAGTYANLSLTPSTGLYVTSGPSSANTQGTIYQLVADDPNPLPSNAPAGVPTTPSPLPADTTKIAVEAQQASASSPLGPFTAPTTPGQGVYYLVEAQINSGVDTSPQAQMFISSSGTRSYLTVNTDRTDQIVYQVKAGTASTTPTAPTVDTGWIAIGYVGIPQGATQTAATACPGSGIPPTGLMAGACITMAVPFSGFLQGSTVVHVNPSPSPSPDSGNAAITGQFAASQLISTVATGTPPLVVSSTTQVANLNAALAGNVTGVVAVANGGTGSAAPTGTTCGASANLSCTGGFPNTVVDLKSSISLTGVTATNGSVTTLTLPSLLNAQCLGTNGSGVVQVGSCGSSFTVNGTSPISVSQVGSTATVSCPNCAAVNNANTFSAAQSLAATGTATSGTQHYPSYALQENSSDWNGSAAVTTTGTLTFANGVWTFGPASSNLQLNGSTLIGPAANGTSTTNYGSNGGFGLQNSIYIGTPSAPTLGTIAGTSNGATEYVEVTEVNASGETLASTNSTLTPTTAQQIQVTSPVTIGNATGYNVYESTASAGTYYLQNTGGVITLGTNYTIPGTPASSGTQPPSLGNAAQVHTWQWIADNAGNLLGQYDNTTDFTLTNAGALSAAQLTATGQVSGATASFGAGPSVSILTGTSPIEITNNSTLYGLEVITTTSNARQIDVANSGDAAIFGVESSAGGHFGTGTSPYDTVVYSGTHGFDFVTNGAARLLVSGSGVVSVPGLTASQVVCTDGSKNLSSCTKHVKLAIGLGFYSGTVSTGAVYPVQPVVDFTNGEITGMRAACSTVDNGTTVVTLYKNGVSVGTLTLGTGNVSTVTFGSPITIAAGDYLNIAITTAGTGANCGFIGEGQQDAF